MNASVRSPYPAAVAALTLFLLLLGGLAALAPAPAAAGPSVPLACEDGAQPGGAPFRICLPAFGWNGSLVVYAHGYVAPDEPIGIPEDQLSIGGFSLADAITLQGYAFAVSGYRRNGLAIREGVEDLVELVALFRSRYGAPHRVILTGVSEGGAIAVLGLERHPEVFDAGLALCGPYGDFQRQVDYFTDFRVVFDYFFPGVIAGTPITIPDTVRTTWTSSYYSETVRPLLLDPASALSMTQVISVTGAAVDATNVPTSTAATFERLLWYNIISTNDATQQLGGNPFGNRARVYRGALDDDALNLGVFRVDADAAAVTTIGQYYESAGTLRAPLITLHTTGDEVTPYWHAVAYEQKVTAVGSSEFYEPRRVERFGHCNFTLPEVQDAFTDIAQQAAARLFYLPAITAEGSEEPK